MKKVEVAKTEAKSVIKWDVVPMAEVPPPPPGSRLSQFWFLYKALCELPKGHSARVPVADSKELTYMRSQLNSLAKKDDKRILSSRNDDNTVAWFWLAPIEGKK